MLSHFHDKLLSCTHGHDQLYTWVTVDVITKQEHTVQSSGFWYIRMLKAAASLCWINQPYDRNKEYIHVYIYMEVKLTL